MVRPIDWATWDEYEDSVVAELADSLKDRGMAAHKSGDHDLGNEYYLLAAAAIVVLATRQAFDYGEGSTNS